MLRRLRFVPIGDCEVSPVARRLFAGHVLAKRRGGVGAGPGEEFVEQLCRVGFAPEHRAEQIDRGGLVDICRCGRQHAGEQLVGRARRPLLPSLDHGCRMGERPGQMEVRRRARRMRTEDKRCDHPEVARARAAERPKQLTFAARVAIHHAAVGEHDLGSEQLVGGQAVLPAEDPESTAQREARDPNRRTRAGSQGQASLIQRGVDLAKPCAGTDGGDAVRHGDRAYGGDVDHDSFARRSSREAVPAAARRRLQS